MKLFSFSYLLVSVGVDRDVYKHTDIRRGTSMRDREPSVRALPEVLRCGVLGVPLNAPKPDENPSGMRGNEDEAMKSTDINLHQS
ncbi:MAG: hypothetical protein QXM43_04185 [Desulfurococcaceae archaeon]